MATLARVLPDGEGAGTNPSALEAMLCGEREKGKGGEQMSLRDGYRNGKAGLGVSRGRRFAGYGMRRPGSG